MDIKQSNTKRNLILYVPESHRSKRLEKVEQLKLMSHPELGSRIGVWGFQKGKGSNSEDSKRRRCLAIRMFALPQQVIQTKSIFGNSSLWAKPHLLSFR